MVVDCFLIAESGVAPMWSLGCDYLTGFFVFKTTSVLAFRRPPARLANGGGSVIFSGILRQLLK
jgi:hypothetical protein